MENPYLPPTADLGDAGPPPTFSGRPLPWEEVPPPEGSLGATLRLFYTDTRLAGEGLAATQDLGRALLWYLLLGFLPGLLLALLNILHPIQPFWMAKLGMPAPQAAQGAVLAFALVSALIGGVIAAAIMLALMGLVLHATLWMLGGTRAKKGLLVTFRAVLYTLGAMALISTPMAFLQHLPGLAGQAFQILGLPLGIVTYSYLGLMLSRAHGTEGWRGVVAAWIPALLFALCCGGALLALWHFGGESFQQAFRQGLRGGR